MKLDLSGLARELAATQLVTAHGRLVEAVGPVLEAELPALPIGAACVVEPDIPCEVVGFRGARTLLVPLGPTDGAGYGARVRQAGNTVDVGVGAGLIGRVIDALGRPMDGGPPIAFTDRRPIMGGAPAPLQRARVHRPLDTGVRALDAMLPLGCGQRISVMAGSGVGKSTLLGAIARNVRVDVNVICLLGERGREVREFVEDNLGKEGLARSVVVVVTSEQPAALQVKGAFTATAIAEWFRDQGLDVLLMMDSLTRLALAQRQIGLAAGEPPTTRGYTPSAFALLPRLLERAGPGAGEKGTITGIYTVLVEGDDVHDPIGDAVRGIVDGHVVLSRKLASHGHYPAIDVLASLSRLADAVSTPEHRADAARVRDWMATYAENEELVRLGAYRKGASAEVDQAIAKLPAIHGLLKQGKEPTERAQTIKALRELAR